MVFVISNDQVQGRIKGLVKGRIGGEAKLRGRTTVVHTCQDILLQTVLSDSLELLAGQLPMLQKAHSYTGSSPLPVK
jgi:hypothetical protein